MAYQPKSPVLSSDLIDRVNVDKPLISRTKTGTRKISGQLLSPPSTISSDSSGSMTTGPQNDDLIPEDIEVPESLYSKEAFEWIGFNPSTAKKLFQNWSAMVREKDLEEEVKGMLHGYVCDRSYQSEDPWVNMEEVGISKKLQTAIMDPDFEDVHATRDLQAWIWESLLDNLLVLEQLNSRIENALRYQKSGPSLRGGEGSFNEMHGYSLPGHKTLYRATTAARLQNVFVDSTRVRLEESLGDLEPQDFTHTKYMPKTSYWSPQFWVARRYADYSKRRGNVPSDICILRMSCPDYFFTGPDCWSLDYGDDWKQMVWHCRKTVNCPPSLVQKFSGKKTITGPMTMVSNSDLKKVTSWSKLTRENLWIKNNEVAYQYVFVTPIFLEVNDRVKGKVALFTVFQGKDIKFVPEPRQWVQTRLAKMAK
jgi:hypothetical protein